MAQDVKKDFEWGILGCGWLGTAWGLQCTSRGDRVWGSARRPESLASLKQVGLHPEPFDSGKESPVAFPGCANLLIALPPLTMLFSSATLFSNNEYFDDADKEDAMNDIAIHVRRCDERILYENVFCRVRHLHKETISRARKNTRHQSSPWQKFRCC